MAISAPCHRCHTTTYGTFGSLAYCFTCLRQTRREMQANIAARSQPQYAPGVLRCDRCGAIRAEGGDDDWFVGCSHGGHETPGTDPWRCNGWMQRIPLTEAQRLLEAETEGNGAA